MKLCACSYPRKMTEENLEESFEDDASTKVLYDQLQNEYNKLLKQYAAAENTIDELRTGATVHLSPKPLESRPNSRLNFEEEKYSQTINFPKAHRASTSSVSAINEMYSKNTIGGHNFVNQDERVKFTTQEQNTQHNLPLQARIQALKEDVDAVEGVLSESGVGGEGLNEVLVICTQLRKEHGVLAHELKLQSRNVNICRPTLSDINHLSTKAELGKELYRIGLRIEEIQRDVTASIKAKNAASEVKFVKPQNGDKPPLNSHLQILIKEMKDLKDASIKSSEGVLNNSRVDNTTLESVSTLKKSSKMSNKEQRRHLEPEHDVVDSRYFSANPVSMESGSEGSGSSGEQMFNMTWPPSRNVVDTGSSNTLRSFLETTQDYGQDSPKSSQGSLNSAHDHKSLDSEPYLNSARSKPRMNSNYDLTSRESISDHIKVNNGQRDRVLSPRNHSILNEYRQRSRNTEDDSTDNFGTNSKPKDSIRHSPREKHSSQFTQDLDKSKAKPCDRERKDHSENTPYSDQETPRQKDEQSKVPKLTLNFNQNTKHRLRSPDTNSGPQKFNSMSSLADSSRMSTPLFQPRGVTRLSPPRYKRRNPSDGFDSGFVGSEASRSSRLTTDHPDGIPKLNLSNQLDSSLHLDLVSEMNENESSSSPEQVSTAYELTEDDRRSPREAISGCQLEDSKFVNTSPSPPSSPERIPRTPAKYFGYRTSGSRLRGSGNSLPGRDTGLTDHPSLSHVSDRLSIDRRSSLDQCSGVGIRREYSGSGSRDVTPDVTADNSERVKSQDKTNELKNERKLQALRDELDSLHDRMNKLDDPRDIMGMYDELRHHDKQLRRVQERRHERNLLKLRQTIEQLNRDINSRYRSGKHRRIPYPDPEFYDDFRSELQKVTDKLDELTTLRDTSDGLSESPYTYVSRHEYEDINKRFSNLVRKVDELRHTMENDAPRENSRYFCEHCNEVGGHHHGHRTVITADHQPRTSTPFVSDIQATSGEATTAKLDHRSCLSSTYPDVLTHQPPVIHHIHTYHRPGLGQHNESESSSDEDNYVKRTPHRKRRVHRSRYRSRRDISYDDHVSLDEARKAARDVQRLSKNILNSITFDLTTLRS